MEAYKGNLLNSIVLIGMGLWGYFDYAGDSASKTALIPVAFGVLFLILSPAVKRENKVVAHIVVLLTLLVIISLFKPLTAALGADRMMAIIRVSTMIVAGVFAMFTFIKSFRDARKAREAQA